METSNLRVLSSNNIEHACIYKHMNTSMLWLPLLLLVSRYLSVLLYAVIKMHHRMNSSIILKHNLHPFCGGCRSSKPSSSWSVITAEAEPFFLLTSKQINKAHPGIVIAKVVATPPKTTVRWNETMMFQETMSGIEVPVTGIPYTTAL